jgi:uncharacterized protein YprB with RNaseH-like and TPR domain
MSKSKDKPRVLFFDVETTPIRAYVWQTGKQFINYSQIIKGDRTKIICIAYKWEHENRVRCLTWDLRKQSCDQIIDEFSKIVSGADVAIGHNGDRFDVKQINTQRLLSGKPPISWPTTEDSLKQLKQIFFFPSYKLDYISKLLLNEGKSPMVLQDWIDILERKDKKALNKMVKYCKRDVALLAEAYGKVKPFLTPKVSRALLTGGKCRSCGSARVSKDGTKTLVGGRYQRYQCQDCGHKFRDSQTLKG